MISSIEHSQIHAIVFIYTIVPSGPPQKVVAVTTFRTSINVSWERPLLNESNGIIVAYRIRYFIRRNETIIDRFNQTETSNLPSTTFFMEFTGLQEGVEYGFEVLAITVGDGPYSPVAFNETESARKFCCSFDLEILQARSFMLWKESDVEILLQKTFL